MVVIKPSVALADGIGWTFTDFSSIMKAAVIRRTCRKGACREDYSWK